MRHDPIAEAEIRREAAEPGAGVADARKWFAEIGADFDAPLAWIAEETSHAPDAKQARMTSR
jgi:hypothetical protein